MTKKSSAIEIEEIRLCEIRLDKTQSRASINADAVAEYAELLRDGVKLPPMLVYHDNTDYWLADGFHRHGAGCNLGLETYPCEIRKGTWQDALKESVGANREHGVRRTNDDKRHAVELAFTLADIREMSDQYVADLCGVGRWLVSDVRRLITQRAESAPCPKNHGKTRVGKDGKRYDVPPRKARAATTEAAPANGRAVDFDPPPLPEPEEPERQLGDGNALADVQDDLREIARRARQLAKDIRVALRCDGDEITRPFCGCYSLVTVQHPLNHVARVLMNDLPVGGTPKKPILFHEQKARSLA